MADPRLRLSVHGTQIPARYCNLAAINVQYDIIKAADAVHYRISKVMAELFSKILVTVSFGQCQVLCAASIEARDVLLHLQKSTDLLQPG